MVTTACFYDQCFMKETLIVLTVVPQVIQGDLHAPACDQSGGIGMFSGDHHLTTRLAFHNLSVMTVAAMDGEDGCYGCTYSRNLVNRGAVATSVWDTGNGWTISDNTVIGGPEWTTSSATMLRTLGDYVRIERNDFRALSRMTCGLDTVDNQLVYGTDD